ncbi:MAG: hypothetical protein LBU27_01440 [Candidatus Peribacteria bacterium]|jgi:hypothetical protein|nr:hypothetical protein [Candidatus Peribacteria bacterium]
MMNGQRVFILDTPDYKITIPFNGQLKVEQQPQMSHEEMNTPIKGQEKSPAYHRAEHAIENPDGNKVQLSNL